MFEIRGHNFARWEASMDDPNPTLDMTGYAFPSIPQAPCPEDN